VPVLDKNLKEVKRFGREMDLLAVPQETPCVSVHYELIEAIDHTHLACQL
jgi:hypothetical protein